MQHVGPIPSSIVTYYAFHSRLSVANKKNAQMSLKESQSLLQQKTMINIYVQPKKKKNE